LFFEFFHLIEQAQKWKSPEFWFVRGRLVVTARAIVHFSNVIIRTWELSHESQQGFFCFVRHCQIWEFSPVWTDFDNCYNLSKRKIKLILKILLSDLEPLKGSSNKKTLYSTRFCVDCAFFGARGPLKRSFHSRLIMSHLWKKRPNLHTNSLNKLLLSVWCVEYELGEHAPLIRWFLYLFHIANKFFHKIFKIWPLQFLFNYFWQLVSQRVVFF
jgi:hypothetical protein